MSEPADLLTAIATVFRSSQVSREYRQLAKLLPAGHDSRAREPAAAPRQPRRDAGDAVQGAALARRGGAISRFRRGGR